MWVMLAGRAYLKDEAKEQAAHDISVLRDELRKLRPDASNDPS